MPRMGCWRRQPCLLILKFIIAAQSLFLAQCSVRWNASNNSPEMVLAAPAPAPVQLIRMPNYVVMDNGHSKVTLSTPQGMVTGIEFNGIPNLLEYQSKETDRGYWDVVWSDPGNQSYTQDDLQGTKFEVIFEDENKIEVSFTRIWDSSPGNRGVLPLNIDRRFVMLRGSLGFYTYSIYEYLKGWPDVDVIQARVAFKLQENIFHYMAISDNRQRAMPSAEDRLRGQILAYKEAVLLTNPSNPAFKREVDDKYQYSMENKDSKVHGWIGAPQRVGFWLIMPSYEFRCGGPVKQELSSHVGPTTLGSFFTSHYAGSDFKVKLEGGTPWKKVFGPVFIYMNTVPGTDDPIPALWTDAKKQMVTETNSWPYNFPASVDYPQANQRGTVTGRLLVRDRFIKAGVIDAGYAYVGLAPPGDEGSWQFDAKGYQFWIQADAHGNFVIRNIRPGSYNLYAWVPGIIGDYKYNIDVTITQGIEVKLGDLVYDPPRNGPTLWEIGIPDRTAAEFNIPKPNRGLVNRLYVNHPDKFRQYGLWDRYTDLYPTKDLIYTVGVSNFRTDWFYAHVARKGKDGNYEPTTWRISFNLSSVVLDGTYTLRIALASATAADTRVSINDPAKRLSNFGGKGRDNSIARHGIHGLYWVYSLDVPANFLQTGVNTIFLSQAMWSNPFIGVMYDYLRLEGPP